MPIYEYECQSCGRRMETMQKVSDPPLETCSVCQGTLKKLISAPAFQFKGSGWYVTDYAGKGEKRKGEGDSAKESDSSKESKSKESKGGDGESAKSSSKESSSGGSKETKTSSSSKES